MPAKEPTVYAMVLFALVELGQAEVHRDVIRKLLPEGAIRVRRDGGTRIVTFHGQPDLRVGGRNIVTEKYNKALRALHDDKVIERSHAWVRIINPERLKEMAAKATVSLNDLDLERALAVATTDGLRSQHRILMRQRERAALERMQAQRGPK